MKNTLSCLLLSILIIIVFSYNAFCIEVSVGTIKDLRKPLEEIKIAYEKSHPYDYISYNYFDDKDLFKTLKEHPHLLDIIIIDNIKSINKAANEGYLNKKSIKKLSKDQLCVVVKKSIEMRPFMLYPKTIVVDGVAVGNPDKTSLGRYTKEALTNLSLWKKLNYKLVLFENNELIAKSVGRGFYDGGVMYCSYANNAFVEITDVLNPKLYSSIIYASAISNHAKDNKAIYNFNEFLLSPSAKKIFKKYNFILKI